MNQESIEITHKLDDYRLRVLKAEKLRAEGKIAEADALLPTREEIIESIKLYRSALGAKQAARQTNTQAKAKVNAIKQMDDLSQLFTK